MNIQTLRKNLVNIKSRFEDEKDYEDFKEYKKVIFDILKKSNFKNISVNKNSNDDFIISFIQNNFKTVWRITDTEFFSYALDLSEVQ